jgi:hypothetical protein
MQKRTKCRDWHVAGGAELAKRLHEGHWRPDLEEDKFYVGDKVPLVRVITMNVYGYGSTGDGKRGGKGWRCLRCQTSVCIGSAGNE